MINVQKISFTSLIVAMFFVAAFSVTTNAYALGTSGCDTGCGGTPTTPTKPKDDPKPPRCNISANISVAEEGDSYTITWRGTPSNATFKVNNAPVAASDSATYTFGNSLQVRFVLTGQNRDGSCEDEVIVKKKVVESVTPSCVISANPTSVKIGNSSTLTWSTYNAVTAVIDQTIGSVAVGSNKSTSVTPNATKTYTMTVTGSTGQTASCHTVIGVYSDPDPVLPTCTLDVSATSVRAGSNVTLTWTTDNATAVSISNVGSVALDGNTNVTVNSATTYTLTATKGSHSVTCAKTVTTTTGGGGGSSNPRCELETSKTKINGREEITLSWETSRGNEVTIYEGTVKTGKKIFYSDDDDTVDEGSIKVTPKGNTTYTLLVERGSKDRTCTVKVEGDDKVFFSSVRNQNPVVTGIVLTNVPYTGFEAGPALTILFYTLLALWGLFVAYNFAVKKDSILGFSLSGAFPRNKVVADLSTEAVTKTEEVSKAAAYVATATDTVPVNLPTGIAPITGYANAVAEEIEETEDTDLQFTDIENRAHAEHVLLSSDAIRYFVGQYSLEDQFEALDGIIEAAKGEYPTEDGWIVLNLERMQSLIDARPTAAALAAVAGETPAGVGSLAEAVVVGNMGAAYAMIGHRPMIALADAAADLDAVYRKRQGNDATTSALLEAATAHLTVEKLHEAINALTTALDGIYTNEGEAVKMALLKASKVLNG